MDGDVMAGQGLTGETAEDVAALIAHIELLEAKLARVEAALADPDLEPTDLHRKPVDHLRRGSYFTVRRLFTGCAFTGGPE
jgi:hypothetical protein